MTEPVAPLTGSCMCGAVRFGVSAPLLGAAYCHCKRCQRRTGTAFSVSGLTQVGSFSIMEGADAVGTYRPGDGGWDKSFCSACGSQLFSSKLASTRGRSDDLREIERTADVEELVEQLAESAELFHPTLEERRYSQAMRSG